MIAFSTAILLLCLLINCMTAGPGPALMIDVSQAFIEGTVVSAFINLWLLAIRKYAWQRIFFSGFIAPAGFILLTVILVCCLLKYGTIVLV